MFTKTIYDYIYLSIVSKFLVMLCLLYITNPAIAVEARKPELSLAERILQQKNPQREQFYGDVKLLHSPNPMDVQFSEDGSVLFSQAETVRMWRSDNGAYLGSISGPVRFRKFAKLNNSRWIVTLDDIEEVYQRDGRFIIPQVIPQLRIWDVITGSCLGVRSLTIPVNTTKIWFPAIETAEQFQMTYVIVRIDDDNPDTQRKLLGYHGQNLIPTFQLTLEDEFDSLTWDPQTRHLYLYGNYKVSCFDPASQKVVWTTARNFFDFTNVTIDQLMVIDQPLHLKTGELAHKEHSSSILLTFQLNTNLRPEKHVLLRWGLMDPLSGKPIKSGVVTRDLKPIDKLSNKKKEDTLIYWLFDGSIKAVNILENQLLLTGSEDHEEGVAFSHSRNEAGDENWYLYRSDYRDEVYKIVWSQAANRVCSIGGDSEEIELFDSRTAKPVASASGTVNALSKFSAQNIAASMDWNEAAVFEFKSGGKFIRTFNTKILQSSCVALSADTSNLLVGETSGNASVWGLSNHKKKSLH